MPTKIIAIGILIVIVLFLAANCLFSVSEGQTAILLRIGQVATDSKGQAKVYGPGLHVKLPFINSVRIFDTRLQSLDAESPRILTKEQKYLYVDYYAKWEIVNVPLYYTRTGGNISTTQSLLIQKINDAIRNEFGKRELHEVITDDRLKIMVSLQKAINQSAEGLGIKVIDVRIKSIDLLAQVLDSVYQRMSTKREQVATEYRSEGEAVAEKTRATADARAQEMIADAERDASVTRASGDAEAAKIYLPAYTQDPAFYAFYRSLEAYRRVFNKDTIMVLKPDSDFFKYFSKSQTSAAPAPVNTGSR